jgi:MscS family membrane protein
VDINLYYFTKTTDWILWRGIVEEHMLEIMKIIEASGSSFAFPSQSIYVEGIDETKIGALNLAFQPEESKI